MTDNERDIDNTKMPAELYASPNSWHNFMCGGWTVTPFVPHAVRYVKAIETPDTDPNYWMPKKEPSVPLSEVLELLELDKYTYKGKRHLMKAVVLVREILKQKYGEAQ